MVTLRYWFNHLAAVLICVFFCTDCGNRQTTVAASTAAPHAASSTPPPSTTQPILAVELRSNKTYHCPLGGIQFDYPGDWQPDKAQTAVFAITAPPALAENHCSLNLDVPKLPWHLAGMISVGMVASGYEKDLKKNQMHDAVEEEECALSVPGAVARRITSCGHENGKTLVDMAVFLIHADHVYIFSADCDDQSRVTARKTLDTAIASLKWTK